jgi:hypothetical protein
VESALYYSVSPSNNLDVARETFGSFSESWLGELKSQLSGRNGAAFIKTSRLDILN